MQDLTKGSLARNVLKMSSFMLVSMVFQTLYFLVDLYFVGRLGKDAVAAVSVSGNLTFLVLAATQTLGVGTTSLIAQAVGRRDQPGARLVFNQSQVLSLVVGVLFFVVMMALRGRYANGLAADPETARLASDYLGWFIPAMAVQFALVATSAALRGTGNFKPGMVIQTGTVLINIVLAPALMFGWGTGHPMGVAGAALASFVAIVVGVLLLLVYVVRSESYLQFNLSDSGPQLALWGRMLKIGLPAGAEFGLMGVYMAVIYTICRPFGAAAQAGFGIGLRVIQAVMMPVVAMGFAVSPVAGQNFGARLGDRVRETFKVGAMMAIGYMLVTTLACQLFPTAMISVFSHDPQVLAVGGVYLRIVSINFVASGLIFVSSSMFQALGNTIPPLLSSAMRVILLALPALWMAKLPGFDLRWIWWLGVATTTLQMTANLLLLRREFGRKLNFALPVAAADVAAAGPVGMNLAAPASGHADFQRLPVVDVSGLASPDPTVRARTAAALGQATRAAGFFYAVGHGVTAELTAPLVAQARAFFTWPLERKMAHYIGLSQNHRGYVPEGEEVFYGGVRDRKEAFDLALDLPLDHPAVRAGTPMLGPNVWPDLPGFRAAIDGYYQAVFALGRTLLRGFALALGLPEDGFDRFVTTPPSQLRLVHYPHDPQLGSVGAGIGAHTDYECFTILLTTAPGLEVCNGAGTWIAAPPIDGAFVVNIGDLMEIWTNGEFVATSHRVRRVQEDRYSFPLFFCCDYQTEVAPLPAFVGPERPPRYAPVRAGEHLYAQTAQTFEYLKQRQSRGEIEVPAGARPLSSFGPQARMDEAEKAEPT